MKTLSSTLTAKQKSGGTPYISISLTFTGKTSYTFKTTDVPNRIFTIEHDEEPFRESARITLNNYDQYFTDLELQGYKVVISYGFKTSAGNETSDSNYLYVMEQQYSSAPTQTGLTCTLICIGQRDAMAEERADANYIPTTDTTKTLISGILGSTLAAFDDQPALTVSYDSEDTLLSTFVPGQSFRILVNTSRQAALSRLLMYTKCVVRPEDDGKIHVFLPTTTGTTYNYEYKLTRGDHFFYNKSKRKRIVIPNYISVTDRNDTPTYSGHAHDQDSIDAYHAVYQYEKFYTLASNAEATSLAEAILARLQMNAETAAAEVPMNVGAEIYDYVKITDSREGSTAIGNIGYIHRRYSALPSSDYPRGRYSMTIGFGGWLNKRRELGQFDSDNNPSDFASGGSYSFKYIKAQDIEAGSITVKQLDVDTITLDHISNGTTYSRVLTTDITAGHVLLSSVTQAVGYRTVSDTEKGTWNGKPDDMDDIPNGTTYQKILATDISAGHVLLSSVEQAVGYRTVSDTEKGTWNGKPDDMDDIPNGTTYQKILATDISSGHIVLSSTVKSGSWYDESGVEIDADHGINIYGTANALTTRATKTGTIQCYVGADGCIYAGSGTVKLSNAGINTYGQGITLNKSTGGYQGYLGAVTGFVWLASEVEIKISGPSVDMSNCSWGRFPLDGVPGSPDEGDFYYDRTSHTIKCYNGTTTKTVAWTA